MANTIELSIQNEPVKKYLGELIAKLTQPNELMAGISMELLRQTELAFEQEGPGWPQLKPATVKARGSAHPILQVTGALARSYINFWNDDSAGVGSNYVTAPIHHFGGEIKMPPRTTKLYFKREKDGSVGNRFVKKKKSDFEQDAQVKGYTINIPARPAMPVDASGNLTPGAATAIMDIFKNYVIG